MEVDDIEQNLLQQFSCMGTTDHEVLISQLKKLVGEDVNETTASFFLDMNNWNLQAAICSYFEFQSNNKLPSMIFVKDITIGEGESVPPNTSFVKTWRVSNNGEDRWPEGCYLAFTGGVNLASQASVAVSPLNPGQEADISVHMSSPCEAGMYESKWRMATSFGSFFGETIWVILSVAEGGTLALTQQLTHFNALGSVIPHSPPLNPFANTSPQQHQSAAPAGPQPPYSNHDDAPMGGSS
nr:EOG090X0CQ9 [Sida crystallina]